MSQLADKVSPAVVQVVVSGYGPTSVDERQTDAAIIARQHAIGSGVIVDPAGYIVTNAHVVQGAQRLLVLLASTSSAQARRQAMKRGVFKARLVGVHQESDLAVLKIDAEGLPAIPLRDLAPVKQGELVFALGSPQGLASSMTMGVVSAPAREPELDVPMLFVQTDAPINPGNSGGPLINSDGDIVGINTFILSRSGGSQGLGFAIPVNVVRFVYEGLRKNGRVDRVELGLSVQGISPTLSEGLGLERDWGVVVSDVTPGGPAELAGLRRADIIDVVDGRPIDSAASLLTALYRHTDKRLVQVEVLRGGNRLTFQITAAERGRRMAEMLDSADASKNLVRRLGILCVDVNDRVRQVIPLREPSGVLVVARTLDGTSVDSGLMQGDIVHALNRDRIDSVEQLRRAIKARNPGESVVLQIERSGQFHYLHFEME
ncbi:MAG TPA: trypsin-like peptidase domain-containing protein [Gemmatimonadales bacterium]|nr:trypsin-like peptidase domain-containing protein [Gemmatimonadales bacterium]